MFNLLIMENVMFLRLNDDVDNCVFTERRKCALWIKKLCEPALTDTDAK